ncbi:hypothetical protein Esi_0163_0071 [Ectocarpus siliculosus]|uniref:Uncharacterized protein n=1 Tax=Ectocarpus siliculosus TaxID=2880 RepID=D7FM49_ECTSI|nr:hypothetical protein Esi_0163_0071 [Ectocarpus siliculosus]|eukprot:CBJ29874.1 hypothetical protein Esi_0163_0071 [Ectocarpus siliculosus]
MANIPSPTSCDDYLGIDSWRADEDCARKEKRGTASVRTPDLGRGNLGEARPAGPPGSAPLWNEGGDGRYSVTPQSGGEGNGGHGSTRSKDVVQEAWKEVARGGRNAISKATFILIHVEVHRRMEEMSGSGQCDFRSDAEMNWATSSKGRTMMDFQQFDEACLGMTKGIGAAEGTRRQATFYSVLLEACRTIGGDQQDNDPANRPATEGLVRPSVAPPESPLRGSFPAGFGQTISPNDSGRWLLRSARRKENAEPRQGNQREEEDEDRKRSERRGRQQQHPHAASTAGGLSDRLGHGSSCSSPPREGAALVDGGGDGQRATATSMVGGATCADGSSFLVMQKADRLRSWPPAWVKQCADSSSGGDDARDSSESQKTGIVLARGIFAAGSAHATANTGSQVKALDARLLIGSESQKALLLQEELRSNRARLLEIQRHPGRGPTALSQCRTSPRQGTRADEKPDKSRSPTTCAGAGGGGGGASSRDCNFLEDSQRSFPSHQQHCRAHPSAADSHPASCAVNDSAEGSGTAPPESNLCCAALAGYRLSGATCVDIGDNDGDKTFAGRAGPGGGADGVDSLDGSLEGSLSTGSLSTGAGKSRAAAKGIGTVVRRVQAVVLRDLLREGASPPGHGFSGARPGSRVSTPGGVTPAGKWAGEARGRNKQSRLGER